jgi:ligand-binding sensor domain-containing protein
MGTRVIRMAKKSWREYERTARDLLNRFAEQFDLGEFSGAIESFTAKDGLIGDYAACILKDREGDIWVGTSAGLDRFRRGALVPILLPAKFTLKTLVAGDDGDIWVGGVSGALARIEGNTLKDITPSSSIQNGLRDSHDSIWFSGH